MSAEATHSAAVLADHLPVLQVLIPFVTAPLIVVLGSRGLAAGALGQQGQRERAPSAAEMRVRRKQP